MGNLYYKVQPHHHGLYIREARLRHGYVLAEVASEICDVSYLSKIENGSVVPTETLFSKLAEKLKIEIPQTKCEWINTIFRKLLYQGNYSSIGLYIDKKRLKNHEQSLFEFLEAVLIKDGSKVKQFKKVIDSWSTHLTDEESQLYHLFVGVYFLELGAWDKAGKYLALSLETANRMVIQDPILHMQLAHYHFRLKNEYLGFHYLELARSIFRKICAKHWVIKCDLLWCTKRLEAGIFSEVEACLKELGAVVTLEAQDVHSSEIDNVQGMYHELAGNSELAKYYYLRSIDLNRIRELEVCVVRVMKFLYRQREYEDLLDFMDKCTMNALSKSGQLLMEYYYSKVAEISKEELESFLIEDAIPHAIKVADLDGFSLYIQELIQVYRRRRNSYKKEAEAYRKWLQFEEKLNQMRNVAVV